MSALAPLPPPEPATEVDLGSELDNLRRKADEQAALLRKHQAAVTQLAESVAALVALGKQRNRWINLNSFVAYVLFTVLLGGAMFFLYRSRVGELEARRAQAAERGAARGPSAALPAHDDATAAALYALVVAGDDAALLARQGEIAGAALTTTERAVFVDAVAAARARAAAAARVDDGVTAWRAGKWVEAAPELERALVTAPAERAAQLAYYLGVARWKLGEHQAAATQLERALGGELDAASTDARYYLAAALDKLGDADRARAEYDRFATAYPKSPLAVYARRRSAILVRRARGPMPGPGAGDALAPATSTAAPTGAAPSTAPSTPPAAPTGATPGETPPAP